MQKMTTLGGRIRAARGKRSQAAIARSIGVSRVSVTDWENDKTTEIKYDNFLKLSRELGVDPYELAFGRHIKNGNYADTVVNAYDMMPKVAKLQVLKCIEGQLALMAEHPEIYADTPGERRFYESLRDSIEAIKQAEEKRAERQK